MKKFNDIVPPTDLVNSREYYGMYNSRDFYRGTSFKMAGEWAPNTHYFNDEYIVDFVTFKGALLSCTCSHISSLIDSGAADIPVLEYDEQGIITGIKYNPYWTYVMSGTEGPEGKVWVPKVSNEGIISWTQENNPPEDIPSVNIKGPKGDKGDTPVMEVVQKNGEYYWTSDGQIIIDPITRQPISARGPKGDIGNNGKVYVPSLINKTMVFTLTSDATNSNITVDLSAFRGENGKTPIFALKDNGILYYFYEDDRELRALGYVIGPKGDKGDKGDKGNKGDKGDKGDKGKVGPTQELKIEFDKSSGRSILYCRIKGTTEWIELGPVGGTPGKSPKLIREKGDPSLREDDRILWGYDGVPVSEWTTLCYLDELRGDQNIVIGCPNNLNRYDGNYDQYGGPEDHDKIWYDPCDEAVDQFSVSDFLYQAYLSVGGTLSQDAFEKVFANLNVMSEFEIKFANSFEDLGEPTKDKLNQLWLIPSEQSEDNNLFEEYIVIHSPSIPEDTYMWEKWGSKGVTIDLSRYTLVSPDHSINIEHKDNLTEMKVNVNGIVNANSAIQPDIDGKLDLYWEEF